ncbi:unnamed protein product, partial [Lepidochelys kempii]
FTDVVTPPGNHKSINSGIAYLHKSEFDGSDLDFEYLGPRGSPPEDKHCFAILIQRNAGSLYGSGCKHWMPEAVDHSSCVDCQRLLMLHMK